MNTARMHFRIVAMDSFPSTLNRAISCPDFVPMKHAGEWNFIPFYFRV
jgi:hypothetical protein